ncbi:hypothetical protein HN011_006024 [Eciton burchellii]|nr:hypothetical protein HN011_006024 [Eciton burchellii]
MFTPEVIKKNSLLHIVRSGDNSLYGTSCRLCNINEKVQASEAPKSGEFIQLFEAGLSINYFSSERFTRKAQNLPQHKAFLRFSSVADHHVN